MGRKPIDETGKKYNHLTVIRMATEEEYPRGAKKPIYWLCRCDCGKLTFAQGRELRNGRRVSCGCVGREKAVELAKMMGYNNRYDLTNKRFGHLVALHISDREEDKNNSLVIWKCKCDCGAITYVRTNYLISGHTKSCGCGRNAYESGGSYGEQLINQILQTEHFNYEREKCFKDLRNGLYRFDFYLPELNIVIEYQGIQHYQYQSYFHKTKSEFLKAQERDRRKISYCLANNIKLYAIPYWDINYIHTFNDILQDKYLARSKFHNDEVYRSQNSKEK